APGRGRRDRRRRRRARRAGRAVHSPADRRHAIAGDGDRGRGARRVAGRSLRHRGGGQLMAGREPEAEGEGPASAPGAEPIPAPLRLYSTTVLAEWTDYNDHLSEWAYLLIFGDNADAFFRFIGIDEAYRASGLSLYTAQTQLRHLRE